MSTSDVRSPWLTVGLRDLWKPDDITKGFTAGASWGFDSPATSIDWSFTTEDGAWSITWKLERVECYRFQRRDWPGVPPFMGRQRRSAGRQRAPKQAPLRCVARTQRSRERRDNFNTRG